VSIKLNGHLKTIAKTISWRTLAAIDSAVLIWWTTGSIKAAGAVVGAEAISKFAWFYAHEWVWEKATT